MFSGVCPCFVNSHVSRPPSSSVAPAPSDSQGNRSPISMQPSGAVLPPYVPASPAVREAPVVENFSISEGAKPVMAPALALSKEIDRLGWCAAVQDPKCLSEWKRLLIDSMAGEFKAVFSTIKELNGVDIRGASLYDHFVDEINAQGTINNRYAKNLGYVLAYIFEYRDAPSFDGINGHWLAERLDHDVSGMLALPCRVPLTFYDIAWGMIQRVPVWPLGLVTAPVKADGRSFGIVPFYVHDITHLDTCYALMLEKIKDSCYQVSEGYSQFCNTFRANLKKELRKVPDYDQYTVYLDIMAQVFIYAHERPPSNNTLDAINLLSAKPLGFNVDIKRFFGRDNLYDLLPLDLKVSVARLMKEKEGDVLDLFRYSHPRPDESLPKDILCVYESIFDWVKSSHQRFRDLCLDSSKSA